MPKLGKLCKRGHGHEGTGQSLRYASGDCVACNAMHGKKRRKEKAADVLATHRAYRKANIEKLRANDRRRRYGLTPEAYERLLTEQDGRCAICGTKSPGGRGLDVFKVDHDHATGTVRGLLCHGCNTAIGGFAEDVARMEKAIAYIERHR